MLRVYIMYKQTFNKVQILTQVLARISKYLGPQKRLLAWEMLGESISIIIKIDLTNP